MSIGRHETAEAMASLVRRRHKTINERFKQWAILKQMYRGNLSYHGETVRGVCIITYEDPDYDNYYFHEADSDNDDNEEHI
jgi:hypothetical protein